MAEAAHRVDAGWVGPGGSLGIGCSGEGGGTRLEYKMQDPGEA